MLWLYGTVENTSSVTNDQRNAPCFNKLLDTEHMYKIKKPVLRLKHAYYDISTARH